MINKINFYYNIILIIMLTTNDINIRLRTRMGESLYQELMVLINNEYEKLKENEIDDALDKLYHQFVYPKIRQYGYKTLVKTRKIVYTLEDMSIFKYNSETGIKIQEVLQKMHNNFSELDFEKKYELVINYGSNNKLLLETNHHGIWVDNNIYHCGIDNNWTMYGENETNKEITNEWKISEDYDKIYFTLYTHEELQDFCDNWKKNNVNKSDDSYNFVKELVNYMGLTEFAS